MPLSASRPGIDRALKYLKEGIAANRWHSDEYLPDLATLAHSAGVSRNTMWKAAKYAVSEGLIVVVPGGRIFHATRVGKFTKPSSQLWLQTRQKIANDLANGVYRHKPELPSSKELSVRYAVSYATMRKILLSLVQQNLLERSGRNFRTAGRKHFLAPSTIAIVSGSLDSTSSNVAQERMKAITDALEKECSQRGLGSRYIALSSNRIIESSRAIRSLLADSAITGIVYNLWLPEAGVWRDRILGFIHALAKSGKPIAVFDHAGNFPLGSFPVLSDTIRIFRVGSKKAGNALARHLLELGHRSFAYISLFQSSSWSQERLAGIQEMCANSGLDNAVEVFGKNFYLDFPMPEGTTLEQNLTRRTFLEDNAEQELLALIKRYDQHGSTHISRAIQDLSMARKALKRSISSESYKTLIASLADSVMNQLVHAYARNLFLEVDRTSRSTAWICSSDGTAVRALHYIADTGRQVPGNISVAGFDNTMSAYERNLTSVDFNLESAAYQMLQFVLGSGNKKPAENRILVDIEPSIIARNTTGTPASSKNKMIE